MHAFLLVVHVLLSISLIVLILLQQGKGADAGAAFGSGASSTVFGSQGSASFLSRTTAILATLFFAVSLALFTLSYRGSKTESVLENATAPKTQVHTGTSENGSDGAANPSSGNVNETPSGVRGDVPSAPASPEKSEATVNTGDAIERPKEHSSSGDTAPK